MEIKFLKRNLLQRLFGIPATRPPGDGGCWTTSGGNLTLDLERAPELSTRGGAVRLEGKGLPERVLVVHGEDGRFHAFRNRCKHFGRRLDPVPGTLTIQCCSVNKSTYDFSGKVLYGPAKGLLETLSVKQENRRLEIAL